MRSVAVLLSALLATFVLAGCTASDDDGGSTSTTTTSGGVTVSVTTTTTSPTSGQTMNVSVADNEFVDGSKTISAGTTIRYTNDGSNAHTVTIHYAGNNGVGGDPATTTKHDQTIQPGQNTTYTFALPGTYHVWCKLHGTMTTGMTSTVTVQ